MTVILSDCCLGMLRVTVGWQSDNTRYTCASGGRKGPCIDDLCCQSLSKGSFVTVVPKIGLSENVTKRDGISKNKVYISVSLFDLRFTGTHVQTNYKTGEKKFKCFNKISFKQNSWSVCDLSWSFCWKISSQYLSRFSCQLTPTFRVGFHFLWCI